MPDLMQGRNGPGPKRKPSSVPPAPPAKRADATAQTGNINDRLHSLRILLSEARGRIANLQQSNATYREDDTKLRKRVLALGLERDAAREELAAANEKVEALRQELKATEPETACPECGGPATNGTCGDGFAFLCKDCKAKEQTNE